jgi:hypothetical protein
MDRPPAPPRHTLPQGFAALLIAALVALVLNPETPLNWALDAPLPEGPTLAAIRAGEWIADAGHFLGLDRPGETLRAAMDHLSGR